MADMAAQGKTPDILFWVGCAGAFDERYTKVTRSFVKILNHLDLSFAVLGKEESCTGDPAKRAGNEFLFQMQALSNIEVLNKYNVKKIVTACPHCFNTLLNEYPDLGGHYEVIHHTAFLQELMLSGKLKVVDDNVFKGQKITYHDSCYLGRGNGIYEAPRSLIESVKADVKEMSRCKSKGMCCGAGGAQMFKEEESGKQRVNVLRTEQALDTGAEVIASACPFCMTMMTDGVKEKSAESKIRVLDIAEIMAQAQGLEG